MVKNNIYGSCVREFHLSNCGLEHAPPDDLVRSQWQSHTKSFCYLLFRWIVALFYFGVVVSSMIEHFSIYKPGTYFIYLTNWGILLCLFISVFGAILVTVWYTHPNYSVTITSSNEMPTVFKVYWSIHLITLEMSIVITALYWTLLYNESTENSATNILVHATNSVVMFLDMLMMAYPIRLLHLIQPVGFGLLYTIFTIVYHFAGGVDRLGNPYIYPIIDWGKPDKTMIIIVCSVSALIFIHLFIFLFYKLRVQIHSRCCVKSLVLPTSQPTPITPTTPGSRISMVLSNYGHNNGGFNGSSEKF